MHYAGPVVVSRLGGQDEQVPESRLSHRLPVPMRFGEVLGEVDLVTKPSLGLRKSACETAG